MCSGCSNDHPLFGEYYLTVKIFRNHSRLIVYARTPFAEARAYIRERYLARPLGRGGGVCSGCSNDHPLFGEYYLTVKIFRNHSRFIVYARTPFAEARAYIRERYLARPLGRGGGECSGCSNDHPFASSKVFGEYCLTVKFFRNHSRLIVYARTPFAEARAYIRERYLARPLGRGGGVCSGCSNDHPLFGEYCLTVKFFRNHSRLIVYARTPFAEARAYIRERYLARPLGRGEGCVRGVRTIPLFGECYLTVKIFSHSSPGEGGRGFRSSNDLLFNCKNFQKSFQIDCVRSNSLCRSPGLYTRKVPCPSPGEGGGVCSGCSNDHPLFGEYYLTVKIFRNHSRLIVYARTPFAEARAYIRERYLARPLGRGEGCVRGVRTIILFSENII